VKIWQLRTAAALLAATLASSILVVGLTSAPASAHGTKGSSGSFTFSGAVAGTLKVPAHFAPGSSNAGCGIQSYTETITWDNPKLKVNGKTVRAGAVVLAIEGQDGQTSTMVPSTSASYTTVTFTITYKNGSWQSATGKAFISTGGKAGSLKGTLNGTEGSSGTVAIRGAWAGCAQVIA
jgi:hypothetical protein